MGLVPDKAADIKKLGDDWWPASLADLDKKTLKPIFTTDFVREKAEIAWGRGKTRVVIEAALTWARSRPASSPRRSAS